MSQSERSSNLIRASYSEYNESSLPHASQNGSFIGHTVGIAQKKTANLVPIVF